MLKKLYFNNKENECATFVVFGKASDNTLYEDAALAKAVDMNEVLRAFTIGKLLIDLGDAGLVKPVAADTTKVYTVGEVSSALALVGWTAPSAEAEAENAD